MKLAQNDEGIKEVIERIERELLNKPKKPFEDFSTGLKYQKPEYKTNVASYKIRHPEYNISADYKKLVKDSKEDFSQRVHLKPLTILPKNSMGSVLGLTYIGENFMARRADLIGKTARMVDIHESIHTPDEYETRRITDWILSKERSKYIK